MLNLTLLERFKEKVNINTKTGCWEWDASLNEEGYGQFWIDNKTLRAHRVSYELFKGKIPQGLQLDHLCRVRNCVNPEHLEPVTNKENHARGLTGKINHHCLKKTHCPQGHEYIGNNLYVDPKGHRYCKPCARVRWREWKSRQVKA